jgi:hypothetical protein
MLSALFECCFLHGSCLLQLHIPVLLRYSANSLQTQQAITATVGANIGLLVAPLLAVSADAHLFTHLMTDAMAHQTLHN